MPADHDAMRPAALHRSALGPSGRRAGRGFTLVEILVVVAVVGIIAAILIPNFISSLQKAKQKRTMAEIHETGKALMSWLTDQVGAAAAGAQPVDVADYGAPVQATDLATLLAPDYIALVPERDAWSNSLDYHLQTDDLMAPRVMLIRSPGRDGAFSASAYTHSAFTVTDFDQDIVWADGIFIRWPLGATTSGLR